jgi:hypothetical protein
MVGGAGRGRGRCGWINEGGDGEVRVKVSSCRGEVAPVRLEGVGGQRRAVVWRAASPMGGRWVASEAGAWTALEVDEEAASDGDSDSESESIGEPCGGRQ